ncbi:MAG TPA: phosphatidate cytidylyltransferase [Microbacteriaceae bacterium]|nr:phosphatidate cytidylyltransferase [Microbacteriaceae bacterium]
MAADFETFEAQLREANDEINRRSGRPLLQAILTGVVLGGIVIAGVFFKPVLVLLAAAATVAGSSELANALRGIGRRVPRVPLIAVAVVGPPAGFWLGSGGLWLVTLAGIALVLLWRIAEQAWPQFRVTPGALVRDLASATLVILYVTFLCSWSMVLHAQPEGQWWLLGCLIIVIANDTGAYAIGLTLGKHPMAPKISPKKSWEGFAGGIAASLIAGVLVGMFMWQQAWWVGIIAGVLFVATGTMGDLAESLIKRNIGIKDMSGWMPGHGGVLDRLDSIAPSLVVAFGLYAVFF